MSDANDGNVSLPAFSALGIELEYALVDRETLDCRPIADQILVDARGAVVSDLEDGALGWSNEFFLHVLELKNPRPTTDLHALATPLREAVKKMNRQLRQHGVCLLPGAVHPWMEPSAEACRWSHGETDIYDTYADIFDCQTHGWANLQSMHINLPFDGDEEFARLHAAIRLILPLIPALAASSPVANGKLTGFADFRLETYRTNASAYPSITGHVIPEIVRTRAQYQQKILQPMYRAIAPVDPHGVLQYDWLNSRGAIARFDRNAIEIRLTDTQECISADLAVASAIVSAVQWLFERTYGNDPATLDHGTLALEAILLNTISDAEAAVIDDIDYLRLLEYPKPSCTSAELWRHVLTQSQRLVVSSLHLFDTVDGPIANILQHGTLARRIAKGLGSNPTRETLRAVYQQLCVCLDSDQLFLPQARDVVAKSSASADEFSLIRN
ncbi:MAG: glutamate-cysteine ligase family protein [Pseudomonadota bacterium]|nr:glutamate-cysteine ligase family protein [Pseudomonadota bacterium]